METVTDWINDPPMPDTWSSSLSELQLLVRDKAGPMVVVYKTSHLGIASCFNKLSEKEIGKPEIQQLYLVRKTAKAPAPFVGDPMWERAWYRWDFWMSEQTGEFVAGSAKFDWERFIIPLDGKYR